MRSEAQAFAYLAVRTLKGLPLTFPTTTGVPRPLTGGVLVRKSDGGVGFAPAPSASVESTRPSHWPAHASPWMAQGPRVAGAQAALGLRSILRRLSR